ncbi:armadillo/beta-catenin-like repeat containing protein [Klebsormidium nitens]|uniref:Armadillo/beta-catenin-like repeat containing protein n=1 Tax=Klebsormidium nitens TaxID=105231 RepID=A0A1Y1HXJ7_KLENI|nr:armadillo/beta-catenin-like repeat containing protein [Klebsormidium nitens]|eukprot:GAQ81899.1 armadillo/beta-catenin-like repeat containing protein [Klebsormidium nitens]
MGDDLQKWKGLLKWSMSQTAGSPSGQRRPVSEEDKKFFQDAMRENTIDIVQRMREITMVMSMLEQELKDQGVTTEDLIEMLEELQDLVGQIDYANGSDRNFQRAGRANSRRWDSYPLSFYVYAQFPVFILVNPDPRLRAKAAEVVHTVVQNNPQSQQNVMDCKGMETLMHNAAQDEDPTSRAKALGAVGALIRNNRAGLAAFRHGDGYAALRDALSSDDPKLQRKALHLLRSILSETPGASEATGQPGLIWTLASLVRSPDLDVRETALGALNDVAGRSEEDAKHVAGEAGLKDALTDRIDELTKLRGDDLAAVHDELQSIGDLWNTSGFGDQGPRQKVLEALATLPPLHTGVASGERESKPYTVTHATKETKEDEKKPPLLLGAPPRSDQ